jgi:hypothetical protein
LLIGEAKLPVKSVTTEQVTAWVKTLGVSQPNVVKLSTEEINGTTLLNFAKLPKAEIEAKLKGIGLTLGAADLIAEAISKFGPATPPAGSYTSLFPRFCLSLHRKFPSLV